MSSKKRKHHDAVAAALKQASVIKTLAMAASVKSKAADSRTTRNTL